VEIPPEGRVVHLKGYGFVRVFRTASRKGGAKHWATSDLSLSEERRESLERQGWGIETYHRGIKQCCGAEKAQVRSARAQKTHILLALRSFVRLEAHRLRTGLSWYEAKTGQNLLGQPRIHPQPNCVSPKLFSSRIRKSFVLHTLSTARCISFGG